MTAQLGLNSTAPRSHAYSDPATSHRAEQRCRDSGAMGSHRAVVEALLRRNPGRTASGLTVIAPGESVSGLSNDFHECRKQIRRRLTDLKNAGRARRESVEGESEALWFLVERME